MTSFDTSFVVPTEGDGLQLVVDVSFGDVTFPVIDPQIDDDFERSVLPAEILGVKGRRAVLNEGWDIHIRGFEGWAPSARASARLLVIPIDWAPYHDVIVQQSRWFPLRPVFVEESVRVLGQDFLETFAVDRQGGEDGSEVVTLHVRARS